MEVGGDAPQPRNHSLSSVPDLSDSELVLQVCRYAACRAPLCLAGLCGWPGAALGNQELNSQREPASRALLTLTLVLSVLPYPRPTIRTRGSIRGQRHRTRLHNWFLRTLGISTFCDGGFTYLRPACTRTK